MATANHTALIEKLANEDEDVILETLELIKDKGNPNVIVPVLDLLASDPAYPITQKTIELLSNMKDQASMDQFLNQLDNPKYTPIHHHLLSILWNGSFGTKANNHVLTVVKMGVLGDYKTLIEALTVVENLEAPFDEEQLLEGISVCKSFVAANPGDQKLPLVKELADVLEAHDNNNSDISAEDQE